MPTTAATRLAIAVLERRTDLALSQLEVWQAGGPSNTTLTNIENGRIDTLTNATAKKLDAGLRWEPGTALGLWRGNGLSDAIVITDADGALVDIDDEEFVRVTLEAAQRRDEGDDYAMLGTLQRLTDLMTKDPRWIERVASIRILFKTPSEETNLQVLQDAQGPYLSALPDTNDDLRAAHEEETSISAEQEGESRHDN